MYRRPDCCDRDVWTLPAIDLHTVEAEAKAWAARQVSDGAAPDDAVAELAVALDALVADLPAAREARDVCAWTVTQQYHLRRGSNMPGALGLQRVAWKKIRDRYAAAAPAPTPDALERLPMLALRVATLTARIEATTVRRDAIIGELLAEGWSNTDVARLIGRDPSVVSHMRAREVPAA